MRLAAAGPGGETSATTRGMVVSFVSLSAQAEEMHSQERQTGSVTVSPEVLWGGAQRAKCALRFFERRDIALDTHRQWLSLGDFC